MLSSRRVVGVDNLHPKRGVRTDSRIQDLQRIHDGRLHLRRPLRWDPSRGRCGAGLKQRRQHRTSTERRWFRRSVQRQHVHTVDPKRHLSKPRATTNRGHSDIAIGNVVGSNIFNVFLCLGAAGVAGPIVASNESVAFDLVALFVMTALLGFYIRGERLVTRGEGAIVLGLFLAFMVVTITRG